MVDSIFDITKFTAQDFPGELACIIWFSGCNMRCQYCHNPEIVESRGQYDFDDVLEFLKHRQGVLDGVVFSGGEATLCKDLPVLAEKIKNMGFKVKLDTNGTNPKMLKKLIDENLIDYVALDYKATQTKFNSITRCCLWDKFSDSLELLIKNQDKIKLEIRTTWHTDLLSEDDIKEIMGDIDSRKYKNSLYIQKAEPVDKEEVFAKLEKSEDISNFDVCNNYKIVIR